MPAFKRERGNWEGWRRKVSKEREFVKVKERGGFTERERLGLEIKWSQCLIQWSDCHRQ